MQKIVLIVSVIVFIVSTFLVFDEDIFFSVGGRNVDELEVIGSVTEESNDVRRKLVNDFGWYPIKQQNNIYSADSIYTGDNSIEEITFADKSSIVIEEKSLVTLNSDANNILLNMEQGSFVGDIGARSKLALLANGEKKELRSSNNAKVKIENGKGRGQRIAVLAGNVEMQFGENKQLIEKNSLLTVSQDGKIETVKVDLEILAPAGNAKLWYTENSKVLFRWKSSESVDSYRLIVESKNKKIEIVRGAKDVVFLEGRREFAEEIELPAGKFSWHVIAKKGAKEFKSFKLSVAHAENLPVKLLAPARDYVFYINKGAAGRDVPLSWRQDSGVSRYEIQLSRQVDFSNIVSEQTVSGTHALFPSLSGGNYYWRVKAIDKDRSEILWSDPNLFSVETMAIEEQLPPSGQNLWFVGEAGVVKFSWKVAGVVDSYALKVKSAKVEKTIERVASRDQSFFEKEFYQENLILPAGVYSWNVEIVKRGKRSSGQTYTINNQQNREVTPLSPVDQTVLFLAKNESVARKVEFKWSDPTMARRYAIQVAKNPNFSQILYEQEVTKAALLLGEYAQGSYYWRVRSIDSERPILDWGRPFKFTIDKVDILATAPENKEIIWLGEDRNCKFSFNSKGPLDRASLVVLDRKDGKKREIEINVQSEEGENLQFERAVILEAGRDYQWQIVAHRYGQKFVFEGGEFSLRQNSKVALSTPADKKFFSIKKEEDYFPQVDLGWNDVTNAKQFHLQIAKDENFRDLLLDKELSETHLTYNKLEEGNYFWRVAVLDSDRPNLGWSDSRSFVVMKSEIRFISPTEGALVWANDGKQAITFEWEADFLIESYTLVVGGGGKRAISIEKTAKQHPNKFTGKMYQEELVLPVGEYDWYLIFGKANLVEKSSPMKLRLRYNRPVALLAPSEKQELYLKGHEQVLEKLLLKWKDDTGASKYFLQISTESSFKSVIVEKKIDNDTEYIASDLSRGNYFWRVKVMEDGRPNSPWSSTRSFSVRQILIAKFRPQTDEVLWQKNKNESVTFAWATEGEVDNYNLVITAAEKKRVIKRYLKKDKKKFAGPNFSEEVILASGKYSYEIIIGKGEHLVKSESVFFEVKSEAAILPVTPLDGTAIMLSKTNAKSGEVALKLSWKDPAGWPTVRVLVDEDRKFSTPIFDKEVSSESFVELANLKVGRYFWKVERKLLSVASGANSSGASEITSFEIVNDSPIELLSQSGEQYELKNYKAKIAMNWKAHEGALGYKAVIATDPSFSKKDIVFESEVIKTVKYSFNYQANKLGKIYWRIAGILPGRRETQFSEIVSADIEMKTLSAPPLLAKNIKHKLAKYQIKNNKSIGSLEEVFSFEWKAVPGAAAYKLEVYELTSNNTKSIINEKVFGEYFIWDGPYIGKFNYKITPIDKFGREGESSDNGNLE